MSANNNQITLSMVNGDSQDYLVTVTDDASTPARINLSTAVDGTATRSAIVRFAIKSIPSTQLNSDSGVVFKSSYDSSQIAFLAQSGTTVGQCRVLLDKPDTVSLDAGTYRWDLEVTRQDTLRTSASTGVLSVTAGTTLVQGTATAFTAAKVGDVLQPLGTNRAPVKIASITSATQLLVEYPIFSTETTVAFEIRRGKHRTAAYGPFTMLQSVVGA